jgi:hypothetical protein
MNVIGHPGIGVDRKAMFGGSIYQRVAEKLKVGLAREDHLAVIAALDDVLRLARNDVAGQTGHLMLES